MTRMGSGSRLAFQRLSRDTSFSILSAQLAGTCFPVAPSGRQSAPPQTPPPFPTLTPRYYTEQHLNVLTGDTTPDEYSRTCYNTSKSGMISPLLLHAGIRGDTRGDVSGDQSCHTNAMPMNDDPRLGASVV
eukprot:gene25475-biopygen20992